MPALGLSERLVTVVSGLFLVVLCVVCCALCVVVRCCALLCVVVRCCALLCVVFCVLLKFGACVKFIVA